MPVWLLEQLDKLITGQASALEDLQRQAASQVAVVPGYHRTAIIADAAHDGMTAGLVVNLKTNAFQGANNLLGFYCGQARH
jgi:hypothetical protein